MNELKQEQRKVKTNAVFEKTTKNYHRCNLEDKELGIIGTVYLDKEKFPPEKELTVEVTVKS